MATKIRKFTVTIGKVYNNGIECKNPVVQFAGQRNIAINCIDADKGIYTIEVLDGQEDLGCLQFIIQCSECGDCPPVIKDVCFCQEDSDCKDPCLECRNGVCEPKCCFECEDGECYGGDCYEDTCVRSTDCKGVGGDDCDDCRCLNKECINCAECVENDHCTGGKICRTIIVDGEECRTCVCPPGLIDCTGVCASCCVKNDCEACEDCEGGVCVPVDCGDGVCVTGERGVECCVECQETGECGENEICKTDRDACKNECICKPGYRRVNGICIPEPVCTIDGDCKDPCLVCKNGKCVPKDCPAGQVCLDGECVDECDCKTLTGCSDNRHCKPTSYDKNICGCGKCKGDCQTGCENGCFCDPSSGQCIKGCDETTCDTGLDCGEGCGCDNGVCKPCVIQSCLTNDCAKTLGCSCYGDDCKPSNSCVGELCSTVDDCGVGCTCYEGECESCSNFSCANDDCSNQEGCKCFNGNCVGDDKDDCSDSLTITKNDGSCSITGTLVKDKPCACPKLTLDTIGRRTNSGLEIKAEIRKGDFKGSISSVPRVDDFDNVDIANVDDANDLPNSGSVKQEINETYEIIEKTYLNGTFLSERSTGSLVKPKPSVQNSFNGGADVTFNPGVSQIGTETEINSEVRPNGVTIKIYHRLKSVKIDYKLTSNLTFDNNCTYSPATISSYTIRSQADYNAFLTGSFSNEKGKVVTSSSSAKPFFKWTRSGIDGQKTFRKLYVNGNGIWNDTIPSTDVDLKSCNTYVLDVDCTCSDPADLYVVFCNPKPDFEFTQCNKWFKFVGWTTPCTPNLDKEYYVDINGSRYITFIGRTGPSLDWYKLVDPIKSLKFGLVCDTQQICTITKTPSDESKLTPIINCDPTKNDEYTLTFSEAENISYVSIGGTSYNVLPIKLKLGTNYTAQVFFSNGCDPVIVNVVSPDTCCDAYLDNIKISRECDSPSDIDFDGLPSGLTYYLPPSTKTYTKEQLIVEINKEPGDAYQIAADTGTCGKHTFSLESYEEGSCCDFTCTFSTDVVNSGGKIIVNIEGNRSSSNATIVVKDSDGNIVHAGTITPGQNKYEVPITADGEYSVVVEDPNCGFCNDKPNGDIVNVDECDLNLTVNFNQEDCEVTAEINKDSCTCKELNGFNYQITSVTQDLINRSLNVGYSIEVDGNTVPVETYTLKVTGGTKATQSIPVTGGSYSGNITIPNVACSVLDPNTGEENVEIGTFQGTATGVYKVLSSSDFPQDNEISLGIELLSNYDTAFIADLIAAANLPGKINLGESLHGSAENYELSIYTEDIGFIGVIQVNGKPYLNVRFTAKTSRNHTTYNIFNQNASDCSGQDPFDPQIIGGSCNGQLFPLEVTRTYSPTGGCSKLGCSNITFGVVDLLLDDDCKYAARYSPRTEVCTTTKVNAISQKFGPALNPSEKLPKFVWSDSEDVVKEDYGVLSGGKIKSTLGLQDIEQGETYTVTVGCGCTETASSPEICCMPTVATTALGCNEIVRVDLTNALPGTYNINYSGIQKTVVVAPGFNSATINFANPQGMFSATSGSFTILGTSCEDSFDVVLQSPCTPTIDAVCGDSGMYLTVNSCGQNPVITITTGSGVVSGKSINSIDIDNRPTFTVHNGNGCKVTVTPSQYDDCVECVPNCSGKECGSDGCDGTCGSCSSDDCETCSNGSCVTTCQATYQCNGSGQCLKVNDGCTPDTDCDDLECGNDSCGLSCNKNCATCNTCSSNECVPVSNGSTCFSGGQSGTCNNGSCVTIIDIVDCGCGVPTGDPNNPCSCNAGSASCGFFGSCNSANYIDGPRCECA